MQISYLIICFTLIGVLSANKTDDHEVKVPDKPKTGSADEVFMARILQALSGLKSPLCRRDLNRTVQGYRDGKPWAIASKRQTRKELTIIIMLNFKLPNYRNQIEFWPKANAIYKIRLFSNANVY